MRLHLRRARSQDAPDEGRPSGSLSGCRAGGGDKRLNNKSGDHPAPRRKTERPPSSTAPAAFKSTARANDSRYLIAPNSISYFLFLDSVRAQFFAQRFVRGDVGNERPRTGGTVPRPLFLPGPPKTLCAFSVPFHTNLPALEAAASLGFALSDIGLTSL